MLSELENRGALFNAVVESSDDAIVTKTLDGTITSWNPAAERLFGIASHEAIGQSIEIIVPDELRGEVREILGKITRGEKVDHHETVRVAKDGRRIDISLSVSPIKGEDGAIIGAAKVARDITKQKRDREALVQRSEELRRSNADLEQFAYVASHDLQEPLRMVVSYTELFVEQFRGRLDAKSEKYIGYALDGAHRMQQLIKDLLAYSRAGSGERAYESVAMDDVVKSAIGSLKIAIEESNAEIFVNGGLPVVMGDKMQLYQVAQNLIGNALKFRGERPPRIEISAGLSGEMAQFRVADNGIGIGKEYRDVIFQMFQRLHTRGAYEGSGIGLAIVKKIVERHGGQVSFESEPDEGTIFFFTVPFAKDRRP
jgi:PAS domain S-box-containing protein